MTNEHETVDSQIESPARYLALAPWVFGAFVFLFANLVLISY